MARQQGAWVPVPFQIDQKKPDGTYAFTNGPEASLDPDPNLDANDELVFMVKDSGDRAEEGKWPEGAQTIIELKLSDPTDGGQGWLYLAGFSGRAPRSPRDYIKLELDQARHYRRVVTYEYIMGGPMDRVYPDYLAAAKLPDGEPGKDVLDRLKMRGKLGLPFGISIPFVFDDMTRSRDLGWIDGPVRVLVLSEGWLELTDFIKLSGQGHSLISYYVNYMVWPMVFEIPSFAVTDIKVEDFCGYMDFNPEVYGSHSFSAANPLNPDVIFDGKMSEAEKNLDLNTEIDWVAGFGPQGAMVNRLVLDPRLPGYKQLPYYLDDAQRIDQPEDNPGVSAAGYRLEGLVLDKDQPPSTAYQYYYYMSTLKPEDVHRVLDILDHPVKVGVSEVEK
jgi:hypothetical protein